jgi:hypothetical protein
MIWCKSVQIADKHNYLRVHSTLPSTVTSSNFWVILCYFFSSGPPHFWLESFQRWLLHDGFFPNNQTMLGRVPKTYCYTYTNRLLEYRWYFPVSCMCSQPSAQRSGILLKRPIMPMKNPSLLVISMYFNVKTSNYMVEDTVNCSGPSLQLLASYMHGFNWHSKARPSRTNSCQHCCFKSTQHPKWKLNSYCLDSWKTQASSMYAFECIIEVHVLIPSYPSTKEGSFWQPGCGHFKQAQAYFQYCWRWSPVQALKQPESKQWERPLASYWIKR